MAEAVNDVTLRLKVLADIEQAKAKLSELAALGRAPGLGATGEGGKTDIAKGMSDQIANLRRLHNQIEGSLKASGDQEGYIKHRNAATSQVAKYVRDSLKGVDTDIVREVKAAVGTKGRQKTYLTNQDIEAGAAAAESYQARPKANRDADAMQSRADTHAAALAAGRQDPAFVKSLLNLDTETRRFSTTMEGARTGSAEYQKSAIDAAIAFRRGSATVLQGLAAEEAYIKATADATSVKRSIRDRAGIVSRGGDASELYSLTPAQIRDRYAAATTKERLTDRTRQATATAADPERVSAQASARVASTLLDARVSEARLSSESLEAEGQKRDANRAIANTLRAQAAGYNEQDIARMGGPEQAAAAATWVTAQRRRGAVATNITDEEVREAALARAAMAGRNNAIKAQEKAILKSMIESGELGGSLVQRKLAMWSPGTRTPADFAVGADNLKAKAFTTLGYGASAVGTGMLFTGISGAIKEASTLESTFVRMKGQLSALGRGDEFTDVRSSIKGISTDTGVAATDVAEFTSRMLGVFSGQDTAFALKQTAAAMKLMVVTGIDAATMMQSVIPTAKAFGVGVEDIGNAAVEAGELLGISENQIVEFLGKSAIVAKSTGLSMRDLTVVGSTMAQNLGKDLSASGDVLNKMPALVQKNQSRIFDILRSAPATVGFVDAMKEDLKKGLPGQAFLKLLRASQIAPEAGGLSKEARGQIPALAGNQREIEDVTALFTQASAIIAHIDDKSFLAAEGSQKLQTRFEQLRDTVTQTFERLQRSVESFAETLFDLGIAEFFKDIGETAEVVLGVVGLLVKALTGANELSKSVGLESGLITPIIGYGVQLGVIMKAFDFLDKVRKKMLGTSAATSEAEAREAGTRDVDAAAATREAGAIEGVNTARAGSFSVNGGSLSPIVSGAGRTARGAGAGVAGLGPAGPPLAPLPAGFDVGQSFAAPGGVPIGTDMAARFAAEANRATLPIGTNIGARFAAAAGDAAVPIGNTIGDRFAFTTAPAALPIGTNIAERFVAASRAAALPIGTNIGERFAVASRTAALPIGTNIAERFANVTRTAALPIGTDIGDRFALAAGTGALPIGTDIGERFAVATRSAMLPIGTDMGARFAAAHAATLPAGTDIGARFAATNAAGVGTGIADRFAVVGSAAALPIGTNIGDRFAVATRNAGLPIGTDIAQRFAVTARSAALPIGTDMGERFGAAMAAQTAAHTGLQTQMGNAAALAAGRAQPSSFTTAQDAWLIGARRDAAARATATAAENAEIEAARRASESTRGFAFGARGSTAARASFTSRAFSGGGTARFNPLSNVTQGANAATEAAGTGSGIIGAGLAVPAIGIALIAAQQVYSRYTEQKDETEAAENDFREKVKHASKENLQKVVDDGHSVLDSIGSIVFRQALPEAIAAAGIAFQEAAPATETLGGLDKAGLTDQFATKIGQSQEARDRLSKFFQDNGALGAELGIGFEIGSEQTNYFGTSRTTAKRVVKPTDVPNIVKKARELMKSKDPEKQKQASELAKLLGGDILDLPGFEDLKRSAAAGKALNQFQQQVEDAGGGGAFAKKKYDELKKDYDAGKIPLGVFLGEAVKARDQAASDTAGMLGDQKIEADAAIAQMDTELRNMRNQALKQRLDMIISFGKLSGRDDQEQYAARLTVEALPTFDKAQQIEMLPEVLSQLERSFAEEVDHIADPVARARRRLQGFKIPDVVQNLQVEAQLRLDPDAATGLNALAPWFAKSTDDMIAWVAQQVRDTNMSAVDIVNKALAERRDNLLAGAAAASGEGTILGALRGNDQQAEADAVLTKEAESIIALGGAQVSQVVGGMSGYFNLDSSNMAKMIATKSHEWNLSTAETIKRLLIERRDQAIEAGVDPNDPSIQFLDTLIASAPSQIGKTVQTPEQIYQNNRDTRRKDLAAIADVQKTDLEIAAQGVRGDPLAQDLSALDQAWIDYTNELQLQAEGFDDPAARKRAWLNVLKATAKVEDDRREVALMAFDFEELNARGDPQKEIQARLGKARSVLANAIADSGGNMDAAPVKKALLDVRKLENDSFDADLNVARSGFSILAAQNERNPLASAQIARAQAAFELENARGKVDENEKAAALIRADHAVEDVMSTLFESRANLAIALADAAGDPVKAAEIAANEAKRKLDEAIGRGAEESVLNPLRGTLATANENYAKSGRSREESIIDFQQQMGEITTQTAIDSLRLILGRTREGTDEYMQLALKIHQLEQQAGQDLQFNLPSTLGLPTMYESRRMDQSTMAGIGYQDNRNVTMQIAVNGAQDPMAVAGQVMSAFQSAMASGNTYTPIVGVGQ